MGNFTYRAPKYKLSNKKCDRKTYVVVTKLRGSLLHKKPICPSCGNNSIVKDSAGTVCLSCGATR